MSTSPNPTAGNNGTVRVLARGLAILRVFTPANRWLSNHEIALASKLPRPTVSRITADLMGLGYLDYSARDGRYRLGTSVLALGYHGLANLDAHLIARPLMQELADATNALVVLASRDGLAMVCNEVCHGNNILTLRVGVGSRLSLPNSAMGRALVGALPPAARAALLDEIRDACGNEWQQLGPALQDAASQMQSKGYYTSIGTLEQGVNGVGTVVEFGNAPLTYTLGVAGPAFRFPPEWLENDIGPRMLAIKDQIQHRLRDMHGTL
jgi:DNA-binding IclR family transcriptional regulator